MSPSFAAITSLIPRHNFQSQFAGFSPPTANYYRLPNDWFDIWRQARQTLAENDRPARIVAPLKITEYVIKHTWGWQNFTDPIRLSRSDLRQGRQGKNGRLDRGTGLGSEATISRSSPLAAAVGLNVLMRKQAGRVAGERREATHSTGLTKGVFHFEGRFYGVEAIAGFCPGISG